MVDGVALRLWLRVLRRHLHRGGRRGRRPGGRGEDGDEGGQEMVLLVLEMCDSVLHARHWSDLKFGLLVWVRILFASLDFRKYLWSLYNTDTIAFSTCATDSLLCYMGTGVPPQVFDEEPQLSWVVLVWLLVLAQSMWSRWTAVRGLSEKAGVVLLVAWCSANAGHLPTASYSGKAPSSISLSILSILHVLEMWMPEGHLYFFP
jgi:hypothetical protein